MRLTPLEPEFGWGDKDEPGRRPPIRASADSSPMSMRASSGTQRASIRMTSVISLTKVPGVAGEERSGGHAGLHVIAKHEFFRMRLEVQLSRQIRHSVSPNIVSQ